MAQAVLFACHYSESYDFARGFDRWWYLPRILAARRRLSRERDRSARARPETSASARPPAAPRTGVLDATRAKIGRPPASLRAALAFPYPRLAGRSRE